MDYRDLGRTGWQISTIGFGAWAIGGDAWGKTDDATSLATIHAAIDAGVNFIDTADVYGDGHSERLIAQVLRDRPGEIVVATKAGRRLNPHTAAGYNRENLTAFVERSLHNLNTEALDLLQLHCPPSEVYTMPAVFEVLDNLVRSGKVRYYGVSVERVDEALAAIEFPNVQSVQIIFNLFRHKPIEQFFAAAQAKRVGILARVPLASGLLSGKITAATSFEANDHRNYNRHGESFDQGETFAGVDYATGLQAVEELRALVPIDASMAQFALRWILMFDAVTTAIPGAKTPEQMRANADSAALAPLDAETMSQAQAIYERLIRPLVQDRW